MKGRKSCFMITFTEPPFVTTPEQGVHAGMAPGLEQQSGELVICSRCALVAFNVLLEERSGTS